MALRGIFAPMVPFELTNVTSKDGTCLPAQPLMVMAVFRAHGAWVAWLFEVFASKL